MQPHIPFDRLNVCQVPADFLTNRKQYVRTWKEISSIITIHTGGLQGCALSAFLFIIYTNDMAMNNKNIKMIKYADDTFVIGLIENNETSYRDAA